MAGIGDVQPKSINIPQMVGDNPPVATQSAVAALMEAYRNGFVTTNDILAHPGGNALMQAATDKAKMGAEQQQLGEFVSPDAVQARKSQIAMQQQQANELLDPEAIAARKEAQRLVREKTEMERETAFTKDYVAAWKRNNKTLYKADGTEDFRAEAEGGQKYLEHQTASDYNMKMLEGKPYTYIDPKTNAQITVWRNPLLQNVTPGTTEGDKNIEYYAREAAKHHKFLIQNDLEPGEADGGYKVTPKDVVDEPMSPMITALAPAPVVAPTPAPPGVGMGLGNTTRRFLDAGDVFAPAAPAAAAPVVAPKVTVAPTGEVTVQPDPNQGLQTGKSTDVVFKPDDYAKDMRTSELYKNWAEKSATIAAFRGTVKAYDAMPKGSITTQNDLDLATYALMLASPSASAGGRGMEGLKIKSLEESIPIMEQVYGIPGHLLKTHKFEEPVRQRIILATERKAQELENLARGVITGVKTRIEKEDFKADSILFGPELQLANTPMTGAEGAAGGGAIEKTVTLGGKTYRVRQ